MKRELKTPVVKVGVIGLGWMGQCHIRYLSDVEGCEITAVCDKREEQVREIAASTGARAYTQHQDLINDPEVNTIYIVTPQMFHCSILLDALESGKNILCEKPLALTAEEIKQIRQASVDYPGKIMIDFPQRFSVATQEAMAEISRGALGSIQFVRANFRFSMKQHAKLHGAWVFDKTKGGGLILESSVHLWDAVRYFSGQEVVSVCAVAHDHPDITFEDSFFCIARLSGGAIAGIDMNGWMPDNADTDKRFEIVGDKGAVYLDELQNYLTVQSELGIENNPGMFTDGATHKDVMWHSRVAGAVKRLDEAFVKCIRYDETPATGIEDGARASEITWAVYESLRTGRLVEVAYGTIE